MAARTGVLSDDDRPESRSGGQGVLQLTAGVMGVQTLDLPLGSANLTQVGPARWRSDVLATTTHSMVGFTWRRGSTEPHIEISSRVDGIWQPWQHIPHVHDSPDPDSDEVTDTVGTELTWVGPADGIRLRVSGSRPAGFTLVLLYPARRRSDRTVTKGRIPAPAARVGAASPDARTEDSSGSVPPPPLLTRQDWGADEALRDGRPEYNRTIQQVHVHHTANSNSYSRADVPSMIRGIYAYHTQSLGWSDIGYNFLVDRFGRIWVGRAGGPAKPVRGAHTLGFNATSTGVSAIGNYDTASPPDAVLAAIAGLAAWKLDMYGRNPQGSATVVSEGSDKYRKGRTVTLPVIDGHRDTNDTACPGQHLYDALPAIRRRTKRRMESYDARATITKPFEGSGTAIEGTDLSVTPGTWTPPETAPTYSWLRDGAAITGATAASYQLVPDDVGSLISVRVEIAPPHGEPATQTIAFDGPVKAQPVLVVRSVGRPRRAVVRVLATAAGLPTGYPTGKIVITVNGRSHTPTLVDGRARTVVRHLKPGTYAVQVTYPGNDTAAPAAGTASVTVPAPRA